ncbi:MAG: hypothetical protein KJO30_08740 [Boseongicola sp.]|nr:hypothetical protein [Boseongicola sp.]
MAISIGVLLVAAFAATRARGAVFWALMAGVLVYQGLNARYYLFGGWQDAGWTHQINCGPILLLSVAFLGATVIGLALWVLGRRAPLGGWRFFAIGSAGVLVVLIGTAVLSPWSLQIADTNNSPMAGAGLCFAG